MNYNDYMKQKFTQKLVELYNSRWKAKRKSQGDFAKAMNKLYKKYDIMDRWEWNVRACTPQQVSKWLHGTLPDEENIRCISELLDVDPEYFTFSMSFEKAFHDPEYVSEEDRHFEKDLKSVGIENDFFDYLINRDHFSKNFPFHPSDVDTSFRPEHLDSGIRSKRRFEYEDGHFRRCVTMSLNDINFIKDIQDEVERTISRMFWNKFEEYRRNIIEHWIEVLSKQEELPIDVVKELYSKNQDWFIRTKILLRHQSNEDLKSLDDLIWNYRVENKIPVPYKEFSSIPDEVLPEIDEMNRLRHEDRDELERKAREAREELENGSRESLRKIIDKQNEAILNGTAKKVERR